MKKINLSILAVALIATSVFAANTMMNMSGNSMNMNGNGMKMSQMNNTNHMLNKNIMKNCTTQSNKNLNNMQMKHFHDLYAPEKYSG